MAQLEMKVESVVNIEATAEVQERTWRNNTAREMHKAPRVYVWPKNESIMDNFQNRHSRPTKVFRKVAVAALKEIGIDKPKMVWSQYAGCSCPCSPGFIMRDWEWLPNNDNTTPCFDVHVNFEGKE